MIIRIVVGILIYILISFQISLATPLFDSTSTSVSLKSDSKNDVDYTKLSIVGGSTACLITYGFILQNNLWWKGEKSDFYFNFERDWRYAKGADKLGHFFLPYFITGEYAQALEWCGVDNVSALWYSAGLGLAHQTFVEIRDGFSKDMGGGYLGFSWGDMGANIIGASFPILQQKSEFFQRFNFKISYYPSNTYNSGAYSSIIDDYESTFHWLTFSPRIFLPNSISNDFPKWINFAIGHSVKQLDGYGGGNHELFLSLDWNLSAIPIEGKFWKTLARTLDYYHFPAPAVKIYPNVVWYGLKF
ncbi:MAG: DUF2279 domain-containing protein [Ignavibacteria bacterium]|nr:DUF2279 domain-containing protein [Ignavibacteria bacterium]